MSSEQSTSGGLREGKLIVAYTPSGMKCQSQRENTHRHRNALLKIQTEGAALFPK